MVTVKFAFFAVQPPQQLQPQLPPQQLQQPQLQLLPQQRKLLKKANAAKESHHGSSSGTK